MDSPTKLLVAAVATVCSLALAGCSGDDDGAATSIATTTTVERVTTTAATTTTTTATTVPETTTTAPTTTTTTAPPTSTSPPTAEQTDWIPIVEELYTRTIGIQTTSPVDPSRVVEVAVEGQPSYERLLKSLTDLAGQGLHLEVDAWRPVRVDVVRVTNSFPDGSPGAVTLIVWVPPRTGRGAVDSDGNVVIPLDTEPAPEGQLRRVNVSIRRFSTTDPWRLEDEIEISPAAP